MAVRKSMSPRTRRRAGADPGPIPPAPHPAGRSAERVPRRARDDIDAYRDFLAATLRLWAVEATVDPSCTIRTPDGTHVAVTRDGSSWRVALPDEPFPREHPSVIGVLRTLREALAPDRPAGRLIVAPAPPEA